MKELETRIKVLRAEYNQFLAGQMQTPPYFKEALIRKIIRKYATAKNLKGMQRFQYYNLVAKFNTMIEFYNRRFKQKEQGQLPIYGYTNKSPKLSTSKSKDSNFEKQHWGKGHIISDASRQTTTVKTLYDRWNELQGHLETQSKQIDYLKFKSMIHTKTTQIKKKKNCKAVRYKLSLENGKIKIKAKPIQ